MGVWIETYFCALFKNKKNVTPYVGVWIETKQMEKAEIDVLVTPYVGVWIETQLHSVFIPASAGHTLRGCVD